MLNDFYDKLLKIAIEFMYTDVLKTKNLVTNEEMQKDLNISSFGDRKKLFLAIENLKNTATSISNDSQPKKEK